MIPSKQYSELFSGSRYSGRSSTPLDIRKICCYEVSASVKSIVAHAIIASRTFHPDDVIHDCEPCGESAMNLGLITSANRIFVVWVYGAGAGLYFPEREAIIPLEDWDGLIALKVRCACARKVGHQSTKLPVRSSRWWHPG